MVVVSHFMSIMKKKKKKKKRRRKKEEEEEEEEESLRTVFCSIVRSDFESVCGKKCRPWPDLQLAHQLG